MYTDLELLQESSENKIQVYPLSTGNTFQDLLWLHETMDNIEHDIHVAYINRVKFN
jgi:hypothetical protein